jgi:hypothetical protein
MYISQRSCARQMTFSAYSNHPTNISPKKNKSGKSRIVLFPPASSKALHAVMWVVPHAATNKDN